MLEVTKTNIVREIDSTVEDLVKGDGSFILLYGDFGTGKTTILQETSNSLRNRGIGIIFSSALSEDRDYGLFRRGLREKNLESYIDEIPVKIHMVVFSGEDGNVFCSVKAADSEADADILGGMTTAVETFVKESFGQATGKDFVALNVERSFNTYSFMEHVLLMLRFRYGNITFLLEGELTDSLKTDLNQLADKIELEYSERLTTWRGELNKFEDLEAEIRECIIDRYDGSTLDLDPKFRNLRIQNRLLEKMERATKGSKLAFLIDDLHLADSASIEALGYMAGNLSKNILVLCASEKGAEDVGLKNFITAKMEGFTVEETQHMLETRLERAISHETTEFIWRETGGNPLVMSENVRLLSSSFSEMDLFEGETMGFDVPLVCPEDVIMHRVKGLEMKTREILQWAAILGQDFREMDLRSVLGVDVNIDSEETRAILKKTKNGWRFSETRVRDAILGSMDADERNGKIAVVLEKLQNEMDVHQKAWLRYEAVKSGDIEWADAVKTLRASARGLRDLWENDEAFRKYEMALEITDVAVERGEMIDEALAQLLTEIAELEFDVGRFHSCIETNNKRRKVAQKNGDRRMEADCLNQIAYSRFKIRDDGVLDCAKEALDIAESENYGRGIFDAKYQIAAFHYSSGRYDDSNALLFDVLTVIEEIADIQKKQQTMGAIALNYSYIGNYSLAFDYFDRTLAILGHEKPFERAKIFNNLGLTYKNRGVETGSPDDFEKSIEFYEKSRDIYLELGYLYGAALA
ncbi:MAG: AAA family ATPase, partial [Candidatus Thermoplasmatota archaeon]|nr:AAA family ATPase [Candidatus Thermoplasmatota archaeon]